jgi:hypothetical protein
LLGRKIIAGVLDTIALCPRIFIDSMTPVINLSLVTTTTVIIYRHTLKLTLENKISISVYCKPIASKQIMEKFLSQKMAPIGYFLRPWGKLICEKTRS